MRASLLQADCRRVAYDVEDRVCIALPRGDIRGFASWQSGESDNEDIGDGASLRRMHSMGD